MGSVGKMGRVGKREHHLSARQCGERTTSDARPRSRPYRLSGLSRPKIARDDNEVADSLQHNNATAP